MKLTVLLLVCSLGIAHAANSHAQTTDVHITAQNQTVKEVLQEIESQSGFGFFYDNTLIDLDRRVSVESGNDNVFDILDQIFEGTDVSYKVVDKTKIILTTHEDAVQQSQQTGKHKVTGKVVDEKGEALIGASILEKGSSNGTTTDIDGNFVLTVSSETSVLEISYIGYLTKDINVQLNKPMTIRLQENTEMLDEVVVVG